jgi:hypothetical protein
VNTPSRIVTPERRSDDVAATARNVGENAETARLVRLGLKELAK